MVDFVGIVMPDFTMIPIPEPPQQHTIIALEVFMTVLWKCVLVKNTIAHGKSGVIKEL